MPNLGLNKIQLQNRIYQILESQIQPELLSANATQQNINDIKSKLQQQAKAVAEGVIDEIHINASVELSNQVSIIKSVLESLLNAIVSAPTAPMDGGTTFKIGLMSAAIPGASTLSSLILSDKIS
jgi:hypothetical protein